VNEQADNRVRPRIGKYTITGRIGRGGMGMVYRAWDEVLEREVAIKTLTLEKSLEDEHRQRFQIEAKAAAKLQHPNIVTVFELGEDRGRLFIAMELLSGVDLEALLRSGEPLLLAEKLDVMAQACRGLHFAHERRIVHRDMKPSNIRVLEDGTAKIMDFGIAKLGASGVTKSGMMVGTVHYMSPEQIRGKTLDGRSDVFSMGVILYQLLTGERPFPGEHPTEILYKIVHNAPPPLAVDLGECGPALSAVLDRALAKDADQRHPSASALADDVLRIASDHLRGTRRRRRRSRSGQRLAPAAGRGPRRGGRAAAARGHGPPSGLDRGPARAPLRDAGDAAAPAGAGGDGRGVPGAGGDVPARGDAGGGRAGHDGASAVARGHGRSPAASVNLLRRFWWAGAAAVVAMAVGVVLGRRPDAPPVAAGDPARAASARPVTPAGSQAPSRAVNRMTIKVTSDPAGAALSMDGQPVGVTPTSVSVDSTTWPHLTFTREGFHTREVHLEPNNIPAEVRVALETSGPQGSVELTSSYPVDVFWRGRQMVDAQTSKSFSLPAGEQTVTFVSKDHFLRATQTIEVRGGEVTPLPAPSLGHINIRANPDNCTVFIDGAFIDYPPILNRPVSTGPHTVSFRWPDGVNRDETVEVKQGSPAYVMGRRD
jgi:serine/threonine-protein kinase